MRKIIILGLFLLLNSNLNLSFALDEQTPMFFPETGAKVEYNDAQDPLINVDNMKRAGRVEQAKKEAAKNSQPRIKFDVDQINHQRALDFSTKQNNSLLPAF